jgi:hypothetical protein
MKFLSLVLFVASFCCVETISTQAETEKLLESAPAKKLHDMTFRIMRESHPSCEPNCPEWIFARGQIVPGSAQKFKDIVDLAGTPGVPLIIQSAGGDMKEAMEMGHFIRKHMMDVAVGFAYEIPCKEGDVSCRRALIHNHAARGFVSTQPSFCASACTIVLASGVSRIAAANSVIGTHQCVNKAITQKIFYAEEYTMVNGVKVLLSKTETRRETVFGEQATQTSIAFEADLLQYLTSMGIEKNFLDYFDKAPPSDIYRMTLKDRAATRITTQTLAPETLARAELCTAKSPAKNCVMLSSNVELSDAN